MAEVGRNDWFWNVVWGGLIELIENNADAGGNIDEPLGFVLSD